MIVEAILVGVMCYIASIGVPWFVGNTGGYYYLSRPLISGTIVGLILGDLKTGIIIGAALQAVYISHIIAAGGTSADITFVSYPATALAIISGASIEVAIGLAATIGVLGILIFNLMLTTNIFWIHAGDRALEKNSLKGYKWANIGLTQITSFALRFVPTFLAVFLGAQYAQGFLNSFPKAVLDIMSVLGGMLPALGIALLLSAIMPNVNKLLFFLIGFVLIAALPINLLVLTVIGCFIAYMYYLVNSNKDFEEENSMEFEGGISEGSNNNTYKNKLTKRELNKVFWRWIFMIQSAMNSERLQGSMFGYALLPIFKKYYKTEEEIVQALKPHNSFFDTENQLGAVIPGVVAGLEEAKGNGKPITNELVASIKTSLMGGITGVAATLVMGVIMPLLLSISISLADGGNIIGPIFYTVTWFPLILLSSYFLFKKGYTSGSEAVAFLTGKKAKKITEAMTILGIIAMGGLAASNVNMSVTAVYQTAANSIVFQDLINSVFPKLLPLIITLFSWKMLLSKKVKALGMLGIYIIIAIVGVLLGIL